MTQTRSLSLSLWDVGIKMFESALALISLSTRETREWRGSARRVQEELYGEKISS